MTDTDRPRRGPPGDDNSTSGSDTPEARPSSLPGAAASDPSSSVEKAAGKLSAASEAKPPRTVPGGGSEPDQTSSIERFLNASDGAAPDRADGGGDIADGAEAVTPLESPREGPVDSPVERPGAATLGVYPESAALPANPDPVAARTADEQPPAQPDPIYRAEPAQDNVSTPEISDNPYRDAHPDPEDLPPPGPNTAPPGAPASRGLFGRKSNEPKPWHRDHAAEQPAAPAAAAAPRADHAEVPPKKRGVFGAIWGVVRFLLIGKKRPKKTRPQPASPTAAPTGAPARAANPRRRPRLPSRLPKGLTLPRLGIFRWMRPHVAAGIGKVPGLRRLTHTKAEVAAHIERVAAATPEGIAEIAAETRRSTAGSHIQRPLDMSHRVGRSVEIDIEKIQAAGMVTPFGERTHIAEEFRLIKRPLLLNAFEKGANAIRNGNVIMVASSRSGEGKTFMAVNLAMSIASERDLTVLLIDADVAKPDIPNVLGFEADLGLVDLIADDRIDMSEVIMRTNIENLSVMPAGRPHHLATELLASERMGNLVSELSLRYPERVVIMDSPPALLSSVAGVLALNVGQTLFVVEAERTSQTAVDSAIGLVSACKNINLLLNKSRPLGGGERFGSYQSSYY